MASAALPTPSWLETVAVSEHHATMDRFPLQASLIPIHNKAEPSTAFAENQAKLSNKGVFVPVLRSVKWISVLLYFKRSHFHQELIWRLWLARKMWREKWEARGLSQHGSSLWGSISRCIFPHPTRTRVSPYTGCWEVQEEPVLASDTALANLQHGFMLTISDL